jgi:hypothetical protein
MVIRTVTLNLYKYPNEILEPLIAEVYVNLNLVNTTQ